MAFDQLGKLPDGTQLGFPGNQETPGRLARSEEIFHVYAPSPSGDKLLIVEAKPTTSGVDLKLAGEIKIGVSAFTIAKHQISDSGELKESGSLAWDKNIMSIVTC